MPCKNTESFRLRTLLHRFLAYLHEFWVDLPIWGISTATSVSWLDPCRTKTMGVKIRSVFPANFEYGI